MGHTVMASQLTAMTIALGKTKKAKWVQAKRINTGASRCKPVEMLASNMVVIFRRGLKAHIMKRCPMISRTIGTLKRWK